MYSSVQWWWRKEKQGKSYYSLVQKNGGWFKLILLFFSLKPFLSWRKECVKEEKTTWIASKPHQKPSNAKQQCLVLKQQLLFHIIFMSQRVTSFHYSKVELVQQHQHKFKTLTFVRFGRFWGALYFEKSLWSGILKVCLNWWLIAEAKGVCAKLLSEIFPWAYPNIIIRR